MAAFNLESTRASHIEIQDAIASASMKFLTHTDSIENIGLSARASNALRRAGVHTIGAMLELGQEQMRNIRNLGAKTLEEIEQMQSKIRKIKFAADDSDSILDLYKEHLEECPIFFDKKGVRRRDISIDDMQLSFRANRILAEAGYEFASTLVDITTEQLLALPGMGSGSVREILNKVASLVFAEAKESCGKPTQAEKSCMEFITSFVRSIPAHVGELYEALIPYYESNVSIEKGTLFELPVLRNLISDKIIKILWESSFGIDKESLTALFSETDVSNGIIESILLELSSEGKIRIGQTIELVRPALQEYVDSITHDKQREVLKLRLIGHTLEEIGDKHGGVTRERIRQIIRKCIRNKRIRIEEDKYLSLFKEYSFTKEDFSLAFDTDDSVYIYMTLACDKAGELSLEQLLENTDYPVELRKGVERAVYKNYFTIGGMRVLMRRTELADYVVHSYFQDEAPFDAFVEKYNDTLQNLGLSDDSRFILNKASYANRLAEADNVLWKYPSRLRYYDMIGRDFTALLEGLNLSQYIDVECSSLKLFRSYPELMEEYDLRDEYELHNLLKKLYRKKNSDYVSFSRMPIMVFGNANRDKQVLDLLIQYAPIGVNDLCKAYEEEYGVLARTVAATFISCIDEYKDQSGMYNISSEALPPEQMKRMRDIMRDDYYDISCIKQLYLGEFPDADPGIINSYTIKSMGFKVYSSYVIKDTYLNATSYFRYILTADDVIDSRNFPSSLRSQVSYTSELAILKNRYEIIEFEPLQYINRRRLESVGIVVQDINDYCEKVSQFVQPYDYFTIHSLRRQGFTHPMDALKFDDWFYASILTEDRERYCYQRMGGTKVFCQISDQVMMENYFKYIVEKYGSMEISEFSCTLKEDFGVNIDK